MSTRLILDVMGGDHAPAANLEGAARALPELARHDCELVLLGDEPVVRRHLERRRHRALRLALEETAVGRRRGAPVRLVHAPESIDMADSIRAVRNKPQASINVGMRMIRAEGGAFISAGHSGAVMASALLNLGRLPAVERPAIAVKLPTLSPDGCVLLDVGANVDCRPEHLRDFAVMGAVYGAVERESPGTPRVGLLSNGEEPSKGTEVTRAALALCAAVPGFARDGQGAIGRFTGYTEGKELFAGHVDVVVTDGFVGNLVLKSVEGLGSAVVKLLKRSARTSPMTMLGFLLSAKAFRTLKKRLDYAEYGAAPLLGVAGYVFICHGRSNAKAIKNALLRSRTALASGYVERLERALAEVAAAANPAAAAQEKTSP
jgi:glycerol-3-phosphate acyltransferase PlsX